MVTVNVSTIGSGGDYATIALWEAATDNDLVALDRIEVGELLNQTHSISSAVTITGATTDATHYRILRAAAGAEYDPISDTGAKVVQTGDAHGIVFGEEGLRLQHFAVVLNGTQTAARQCFRAGVDAVNGNGLAVIFDGCVAALGTVSDFQHNGWRAYANAANLNAPIVMRNCFVLGNRAATSNFYRGVIVAVENYGVSMDNCLVWGCSDIGIDYVTNTALLSARNVVAANNGTDFDIAMSGTLMTLQRLASSDATAIGPGAVTGIKPHRAFIAAPLNDFRPQADGPLHQAGVNLSSSFTEDITQNAYGAKWNIGPYGQSVRNGNSRANDTRVIQATFSDPASPEYALIDTKGYDYMRVIPIGGVGTDPASGTITFIPYAAPTASFSTAAPQNYARLGNSGPVVKRATMTSSASNEGYLTVLPRYVALAASGGSGWAGVPVRIELHKASEHWTEAGRG